MCSPPWADPHLGSHFNFWGRKKKTWSVLIWLGCLTSELKGSCCGNRETSVLGSRLGLHACVADTSTVWAMSPVPAWLTLSWLWVTEAQGYGFVVPSNMFQHGSGFVLRLKTLWGWWTDYTLWLWSVGMLQVKSQNDLGLSVVFLIISNSQSPISVSQLTSF